MQDFTSMPNLDNVKLPSEQLDKLPVRTDPFPVSPEPLLSLVLVPKYLSMLMVLEVLEDCWVELVVVVLVEGSVDSWAHWAALETS